MVSLFSCLPNSVHQRASKAILAAFISFFAVIVPFSASAQVNWVPVEGATVQQGKRIFVRGQGSYTENTISVSNANTLSDSLRLVVTSSSFEVTNADGDLEGNPYFDLTSVDDRVRIFFANQRARFSYTAELFQLVEGDSNGTPIALDLPEDVPAGSLLRLSIFDEALFSRTDWVVSNDLTVQSVEGTPLRGDIEIPNELVNSQITISVKAFDLNGNETTASALVNIVSPPEFKPFSGEQDVTLLEDVEITPEVSEDSYLTPASRTTDGYQTFIADPQNGISVTVQVGSLTLIEGELTGLSAGDIIVGMDESGEGFMRKVVSINGNIIATERAAFEEAFPDAVINIDFSFSNNQGNVVAQARTNKGVVTASKSFYGARDDEDEDVDSNIPLVNFNDTVATDLGDGVTVTSDLSMNSALNFSVDYRFLRGGLISAETMLNAGYNASTSIAVNVQDQASFSKEKSFSPLINRRVTVYISGFPVVMNIKVTPEIEASISAAASATLTAGVSAGGRYQAGFTYQKDRGISRVNNFSPVISRIGPSYTLGGEISADAQVELEVSATLYEIARFSGPSVGVEAGPYAEFVVTAEVDLFDPNSFTCDIGLYIGLDSELELDFGSIGDFVGLEDPDESNLFDLRNRVYTATNCPFAPLASDISGFVNDQDGNSLAGASVTLEGAVPGNSSTTSTNSLGFFEFKDAIVGNYTALASEDGYRSDRNSFELDEDGQNLNFILVAETDEEPEEPTNPNVPDDPFGEDDEDEFGNPANEGSSTGDPHLRTFDGVAYDFQGAGEYVMVKSSIDDFEVQARMIPWNSGRRVSVNRAVALKASGDRIGIYIIERELTVLVNGELLDASSQSTHRLPGGARLVMKRGRVEVFWDNGTRVSAAGSSSWISLRIQPSNAHFGTLSGLLGNFDGDRSNEFASSSGEAVDIFDSFNNLYDIYGESWRVTHDTTLFDYFDNESLELFADRSFPSGTTTEASLRREFGDVEYQTAKEKCRGFVSDGARLSACILDILVTGEDIDLTEYQQIATPLDQVNLQETSVIEITSPVAGQSVNSNVRVDGDFALLADESVVEMWYSMNGSEQFEYPQYFLSNATFSFSIPAAQFVPNQTNVITLFALMSNGTVINDQISVYFDQDAPPAASGDILVINDLNAFDNGRIMLGDNQQFVKNMVNFAGNGIRSQGDRVVFDTTSSRSPGLVSSRVFQLWLEEGFETINNSSPNFIQNELPTLTDVKTYVIWLRLAPFSDAEINGLKNFAREGGRIVYISEHAGFMGTGGIQTQNDFLARMGAQMRNLGFSRHGGNHKTTFSTEGERHQMLNGIDLDEGVYVNYVSVLSVGPSDFPLLYDRTGTDIIAGIATIDLSIEHSQSLLLQSNENTGKTQKMLIRLGESEEPQNPPSPFIFEYAHEKK